MLAIVGLGNPGEHYDLTRHNVGFLVLDELGKKLTDNPWQHSANFSDSDMLALTYAKEPLVLLKPGTYVNESGVVVDKLVEERDLDLNNLWVIHDDTEIPFGTIRTKFGGASGGHNGIKSIDEAIGENYWRVKVGVGRPSHPGHDLADYVLGKFTAGEQKELSIIIDQVTEYLVKSIEQAKLEPITFNAQENPHQPN